MRNRITGLKYTLFMAVMVLGVALISEGLLQFACLISRKASSMLIPGESVVQYTIEDPELGDRPNPALPEHDSKGFRNLSVPEQVDIVALGDSQTYGTGVPAKSAWPRQLAEMSDFTTYNMAYGGYGPTHSVILLDEAISLHPKLAVEAFYAGNDLHDSYCHVYRKNQLTWLKSVDEALQRQLQGVAGDEPLRNLVERPVLDRMQIPKSDVTGIREWFSKNSRLYGLLRAIKNIVRGTDREWELNKQRASKYNWLVYEDDRFRTVLMPDYRLQAVDHEDPRILEGQNISLKAINALSERAHAENIDFIVLLIPTKELVFKDLVVGHPNLMTTAYEMLIRNEEQLWAETKEFLDKRSIKWIDATPALRKCLEEGHQPYPMTQDGHPNAVGHEAIARLVLAGIQNAGKNLKR